MTLSISKKLMAACAAALLACTMGLAALTPQSAHAAQATTTPLTTQASDAQLSTQAAKKSVYVRKSTSARKYAYNKYGLITRVTNVDPGQIDVNYKFKYKGTKLVKMWQLNGTSVDAVYTIKYDSKNRVKSITVKSDGMGADYYNNTQVFTYNKKGLATKKVTHNATSGTKYTTKYAYNAKGQLTKITQPGSTETMAYDANGSNTKWTRKLSTGKSIEKYKNTYKNGLLRGVTRTNDDGYTYSNAIKYKQISIPKKYAAAVAKQQLALRQTIAGSVISWMS